MSRAQQNTTGRLRLAPAMLGLGLAALLGAAGCGSGQITQTDSQLPAVNGAKAEAGKVAVRDAMLAFPTDGHYAKGADAPLVLTLVNIGGTADRLVEVTSPVAGAVEVVGDTNLPGGFAIQVGEPGKQAEGTSVAATTPTPTTTTATPTTTTGSATTTTGKPSGATTTTGSSSVPPTSSTPAETTTRKLDLGKAEIVLKDLGVVLYPGRNVPVTFIFEKAGQITVNLPIAAPNGPRAEAAEH